MNNTSLLLVTLASLCIMWTQTVSAAVREYHLVIAQQEVHIEDKHAEGMTINGKIPGPTLYFENGDLARIHVKNEMGVPTSIHWHGLLVPPSMDGVPFVTQVPIQPGTTFTYEFPIRQTGTYWYHSHSELQEQSGLYGSIVISDQAARTDRDYVVLLSDWTTESPASVLRTLKRGSHWYTLEKGSSQSIFGAAKAGHLGDYFHRELQRMPPMDIADIAYDYFLANGEVETTLPALAGERVRLRIINGSATTYFHVNYAGGPMTIISADGQLVEPIRQELFLIGVAETYDVIITVPSAGSYEFRATAHDGSGFSSTWLGSGIRHPARTLPKPNLYEPMEHGDMGSIFALTPSGTMGISDAQVEAGMFDQPGMMHMMHETSHSVHRMEPMQHEESGQAPRRQKEAHGGHGMHQAEPMPGPDAGHAGMDPRHGQMSTKSSQGHESAVGSVSGHADAKPGHGPEMVPASTASKAGLARPFGSRFGWLEADIASRPLLASEGSVERPLTPYSQLKATVSSAPPRSASVREIRLTLDGDMTRYTWFINNQPISASDSIRIREGEVVRFIMINRTMMHHPMHLHGHFFRVRNGQGDMSPLKHTVDVAPMTTTVIEFYGDEVGDWFFHCHLLYHMKSGMARVVHYENFTAADDVAAVRRNLYSDPFYFHGRADILSSMTEGELTLENSRIALDLQWEVGWQQTDDTDWEGLLTGSYHLNRFTSFFLGTDVEGEGSTSEETRGVAGLRYVLPFNLESAAWLDTDGGARIMLEREFELTPRLGVHGEVEYDTHEQWEGKLGVSYTLCKQVSATANYHSEYGIGAGLQVRF